MNSTPPSRISVIIPAHNEEAVIARCLSRMLYGARAGELDIVVACNGCTDRTAEIASSFGSMVRVVETPTASKIVALNLGDQSARTFPRFYVDADVSVSIESLRNAAAKLRYGRFLAVSPSVKWELSSSSWCVRAFYAVWKYQPYFDNGRLGAGLYAVSESGHQRIAPFPMITADDEYVRRSLPRGVDAIPRASSSNSCLVDTRICAARSISSRLQGNDIHDTSHSSQLASHSGFRLATACPFAGTYFPDLP